MPAELRVTGYHGCYFLVEGYCAPVHLDECERGPTIPVPCRAIDTQLPVEKRRIAIDAFTYRDSMGVCHRVSAIECSFMECPTTPSSDVVPCP